MNAFYQKYRPHYRSNLTLAIPIVISQLGHMMVQISDSIIVGHFAGTISLAAVSLVNSVFNVAMMLGIGISYGLTPLIAQQNGAGNHRECGKLLASSLFINIITSTILALLISFGFNILLGHLGQSPAVVFQARPFLKLMALSLVPMLLFNTFKQFAEGLGFTKQAMYISIWGNVLNICLGIIFVKGLFGIAPMGVKGVGYATLIDRSSMALVMAFYVLRSANFKKYLVGFKTAFIEKARCLSILKIGLPVGMQYIFEISAFSGAAILVGTISPVAQAAHQVAINLAALTYMMAGGISSAAAIKAGNHHGAKDQSGLRLSAISGYHIVIVFMSVTAIIFVLLNHILPLAFTEDKQVINLAAQLLIIGAVFQLFDGTQVMGLGILRGIGDVNIPTIITFLAYWIFGLPVGYLLGIRYHLGASGIWYGLVLGLMAASLMLFVRFQSKAPKIVLEGL